ncbi:MAG: hypothetical protein J6K77_03830 [Ruminococcus sp.]|nr:hypothetical protein [Ruminococcus sp.]
MKKMRIVSAAAAVMTLTAALAGCGSAEEKAAKKNITLPEKPVSHGKPSVMSAAETIRDEEWYSQFCNAVMNGESSFIVNAKIANNAVEGALALVKSDLPEYFWLGTSYSAVTASDGSRVSVEINEDFDTDDIPGMLEELRAAANKCIAGIPDNADTYETVLYVHDYIVNNTDYDYAAIKAHKRGLVHSAYGCLVEGDAVCEGYAEAFTYIMNAIGIESGVCTGSNHAWNYVKVDGDYYWLDATWDDDGKEPKHDYFLFTDEQLLRSRTFDYVQAYMPECTATKENYYVKNGFFFEEYDEDKIIGFIEDNIGSGECEMMFGSFEEYDAAFKALFAEDKIRKVDDIGKYTYYHDDYMFTIRIETV